MYKKNDIFVFKLPTDKNFFHFHEKKLFIVNEKNL